MTTIQISSAYLDKESPKSNTPDLEKSVRLSLLVHDIHEILGEIDNFHQRLAKDEPGFNFYDFNNKRQEFIVGEYEKDKATLKKLLNIEKFRPVAIELVKVFDAVKNLFSEWSNLKPIYKKLNWLELLSKDH